MTVQNEAVDLTRPIGGTSPSGPVRRRRRGPGTTARAAVLAVVLFVAAIGGWAALAASETISPLLLPAPLDVLSALQTMFVSGSVWPNLWATAYETLLGFLIAVVSALLVSFAFTFSETVRKAVFPYLLVIQTFPKVAIAPLVIAAFGYGLLPKVVLAGLMAFFPVLTNAVVGLSSTSEDHDNLFRSLRARRWQNLVMLRIPHALSYILPALNTAAVLALIGAIVAEFVSARQGIGFAIQAYTQTGDVASTYALLIVLAAFGLLIWLALTLLDRALKRYKR